MLVWGRYGCGEYMGGTRGSGIMSSVYDVLEMRGVVCEICVFGSGQGGRLLGERIGFWLY